MKKKKLVIVESPTKAKTISRFLKKGYIVESCMGHIRDLPESAKDIPEKYKKKSWSNLGVNTDEDFQPIYCVPKSKSKVVQHLKSKLNQAEELLLATDEDREGESISWHLKELLKPKIPVKRMVFHEITQEAIQTALKNVRQIDPKLVKAQEARRILDRLVGYTISPLLWKKVTRGLSAGRVQSMAVKLISERELERMDFIRVQYWSLEGEFLAKKQKFQGTLQSLKLQKTAKGKDFDNKGRLTNKKLLHLKEAAAKKLKTALNNKDFIVKAVETKPLSRSPKPPFITSTLQQAANRSLNFSTRQTMSTAQKLYEKGFITYMRTDSTTLSSEALKDIRNIILKAYGKNHLPEKPRFYKTKRAQEAHEAIRPAGHIRSPENTSLSGAEYKLYQLIWKRAIASQMKNCQQEQTTITLSCKDTLWSASGTTIIFPGFYKVWQEEEKQTSLLPKLKAGDKVQCKKIEALEHETQPPARYNEASLIQKLEQEGIGRPSTYSPIISTIQDRGYVKKVNKALAPTWIALAVTELLSSYFPDYVNLKFTSRMEDTLDEIANGKMDSKKYLTKIYKGKNGLKNQVDTKEKQIDSKESRTLSIKPFGANISFHVGRYGAYVMQKAGKKELKATLPDDVFPADLTKEQLKTLLTPKKQEKQVLGTHPDTKDKIFLKTGRYGPYLELEKEEKRASIPPFLAVEDMSLKQALHLLELPKTLGQHSDTKKDIKKSIGRYGPYIVHEGDFRSLPGDESFFSVGLKQALKILSEPKKKFGRQAIKEIPYNKEVIKVFSGRYGPYLKFQNKNITIPKKYSAGALTLRQALDILKEKLALSSNKKPSSKRDSVRKASAKKASFQKTNLKQVKKKKKRARKS